ncbi:MAG: hypothetical protein U5L45_22795 [Saprospiraceae bacterium]|nr:hypothetical protein [Saprospiraceae bacterium]
MPTKTNAFIVINFRFQGFQISKIKCNYLARARFARTKGEEVVRFLGFARKTNHIPLFCKRSELWAK